MSIVGKSLRGGCGLLVGMGILALQVDKGLGGIPEIWVFDDAVSSGFQDYWDNHYRRGVSVVPGDFDGDGRQDCFVGNPGEESFILQNVGPGPDGVVRFAVAQVLLKKDVAWAAAAADYDNDGDLDLFVGCGGMEAPCLDFLFRNDSAAGKILFTEVSAQAGIQGPGPREFPQPHMTGGAAWGDYDRDGDQDLAIAAWAYARGAKAYKSVLWRNNRDGTFTDVTAESGLDYESYAATVGDLLSDSLCHHSVNWIDADNDSDLDLFFNNFCGPNVLWKSLLVEERTPRFSNATLSSSAPGEDLRFPIHSMASAVADFNNDGWQDLMLNTWAEEPPSPYGNSNALFLNLQGRGFFNAASPAGINRTDGQQEENMGAQVADLDADGIPDVVFGGGTPAFGGKNRLLLSTSVRNGIPRFLDETSLIDFEPQHGIDPSLPPYPEIPPYPYRGHGIAAADFDGEGHLELAIVDGGPVRYPDIVREPNRLFRFAGPALGNTFRAHLKGNGLTDSRDAIGARAYVEIPRYSGTSRVFQTVLGGNGFSAQNELTLTFGLGKDTAASRLSILWPSGCLQILDAPRAASSSPLIVEQACWSCPAAPAPVQGWLDPDAYGCAEPPVSRLQGTIRDTSGPVPWTRVVHVHGEPPRLSLEARTGADGTFALEHPYEAGLCRTSIIEPFGYVPPLDPARLEEATPAVNTLDITLEREPEALSPQGPGYWLHQAKSLSSGRGASQETEPRILAWLEAIRSRYPRLGGFGSINELAVTLRAESSSSPGDRLRRHLGAALLNLASGRLSSFTVLTTDERVGDLVEKSYRWLTTPGGEPVDPAELAARLEELSQGLLFP